MPAILNVENPGYLTFEGDGQCDWPMHEKYYVMRNWECVMVHSFHRMWVS